ncbi:Protein DA1-related 1 [Platanthera guangdongensis]|uniref:Protein DA1-related 1 n=1 Tax=Platanthera guangdongensis TaxID=2320717 RepID=A0ABR2M6T8_9ASPA
MSWLKKIFKGSSSTISQGDHQEKIGDNDDGVCNEPTNSRPRERPDHAIALSLSEEELKKQICTGTESNVDEDEKLARALQKRLNTKSRPPKRRETPRICAGCENEIGHDRFIRLMGALWHTKCVNCYACGQPLIGNSIYRYEDRPYHESCCRNLYHPKCDVCKEFVPTKTNGEPDYMELPIWKFKSCPSHEDDGTHRCFSCSRSEPHGENYSRLDDRVMICLECLDSSIMDVDECQPLYQDIQKFFKGLNMEVDKEIPLRLVESGVLSKGYPLPKIVLGLCREKKQTVESPKFKRPKISILILKGLPRIVAGLILAHEMMHGWLRLNGCPHGKLDPYVEEGISVVMSYMWLENEMMSGTDSYVASPSSSSSSNPYIKGPRSQFERKLGEFWKCKMENQVCPIYGDGFRMGYAAVLKYGLKSVLEHMKSEGSFPR